MARFGLNTANNSVPNNLEPWSHDKINTRAGITLSTSPSCQRKNFRSVEDIRAGIPILHIYVVIMPQSIEIDKFNVRASP
ncbi:hypothetical protein TNCV_1742321 [Trichonephila clavipes]|nr:hypothetical protein TNCV_1742321 [Trichonephila clavipes]